MNMEYVGVKDVQKLFDQLQSWDKVEFLKEIGADCYLTVGEINEVVKSYTRRHGC